MSRVVRDATPTALLAAELGAACVGIGTVVGFSRLFAGWSYVGPLAITVLTSWALAVATRRLGWGVGWSGLLSTVAGVLTATWIFAGHTTAFGVPTWSTADAISQEVRLAFGDISSMVAPVEATTGFLVVLAVVLWAFTFFADTAAFRYHGPVQAVIPFTSAFVAAGMLARDTARTGSALAFLAGLGVYAVTQRALVVSERRWMHGDAVRGTWAVAAAAALAVTVALLVGIAAAPWLPGSTQAVVDLRSLGRQAGARTVVSPFVGVRSLLGEQSDQVVLTGRSTAPTYWRLTALSQYDPTRDIWVSRGSYQRTDGDGLTAARPGVPMVEVRQDVEIEALGGPWLPVAFEPASIDVDDDISFDRVTSSIITSGDSLDPGTRYGAVSHVPRPTPDALHGSYGNDAVDAVDTDDAAVSAEVARTARRIVLGAPDEYSQMLALQDWFRDGFTYDTDVDYRDDPDPVEAFLRERRGFCQQFASTFALMARSLGVPARVAVGFTQGDAVPVASSPAAAPPGDMTEYVVRGRHAHTWPEVRLDGIGWVPFEPTTGRGNPQAESYTGVEAQQAPVPAETATTTTSPTTTAPADQQSTTTVEPGRLDTTDGRSDVTDASSGSGPLRWIGLVVAAASLVAGAVLVLRRRRRWHRTSGDPDAGRVQGAWQRTLTDLAALGIATRPSDTPLEVARRVAESNALDGPALDSPADTDGIGRQDVVDAMELLASCESERRFGRAGIDAARAADAEHAAAIVHARVRTVTSTAQRVRQLVR